MTSIYQTPQWANLRRTILGPKPPCHWCGQPATELDHLIELDRGGEPYDPNNLVPACKPCNSRRGAEYGNTKRGRGRARNPHDTVLLTSVRNGERPGYVMGTSWWADCEACGKAFRPHPKSKGRFCSQTCFRAGPNPDRPVKAPPVFFDVQEAPRPVHPSMSQGGDQGEGPANPTRLVPPRLETKVVGVGSFGPEVAVWASAWLGMDLMPWQRHVLDQVLSFDGAGRLVVRQALVSVARQNGKTRGLLQPLIGWAMTEWPKHRGSPVTITLVSHTLELSVATFTDVALALEEHHGGVPRWSYGRNDVRMPDGSKFLVQAATGNAGHGRSNDLVIVDECWDVSSTVIDQGLVPSQRARPNPLLLAVSTAGTEASEWMLRTREAGLAAVDSGDPGPFYFAEWSVPPSADPMDSTVWELANPALGHTIDLATLEAESRSPSRSMFLRASLNQWVASDRAWLDPGTWETLAETETPDRPADVLVVDSSMDGGRHVGLFAWDLGNGAAFVDVAFIVKSETEAWGEVERLCPATARVAITPSLEIHLPRQLEGRKVIVGYHELTKWTGLVRSMVIDGRVRHRGNRQMAEQVERAVAVSGRNGFALSSQKSPGPIELTRCMVWGVALATRSRWKAKPAFGAARR